MLVLTRKVGEQITIDAGDERITIVVVSVDWGRVRLGIAAPKEVKIMRAELLPPANETPKELP
jgi:carbon storage regulator